MVNFVVFGKPRAFESYEYVFDGDKLSVENTHREPILKPKQYGEPILHYFVKDGYAGLEYYTRAKGYESERDGIVFGVCMKSETDFNIMNTVSTILQRFWIDFASALLDESNKFIEDSIISKLKNTQWSQSEIDILQRTSLCRPTSTSKKGILLLVSPQLDDIKLIEDYIKEYENVYISDNPRVFKEKMNDIVLREASNQIFKIEDEKIVPLHEGIQEKPNTSPQKSVFRRIAQLPGWGNQDAKKARRKTSKMEIRHSDVLWVTIILALIIAAVIHFWPDGEKNSENRTNEGQITDATKLIEVSRKAKTSGKTGDSTDKSAKVLTGISVKLVEYNSSIKKSLALNPKILPDTCTQLYPNDIVFNVSDESLVSIDCADNYNLVVIKRPSNDTEVIVKAFYRGILLGQQKYTIAKAETTSSIKSGKHIPYYKSKPRTKEQYLADLRKALNNGSMSPKIVKEECQKIINGDYGDKYKNDSQAIALRSEAIEKLNDNNDAESFF